MHYPTRPGSEFFTSEGCHIIEILNSAQAENLSIARARLEPGRTTEWHQLEGIEEYYYILEGTGRAELGPDFRQKVKKGDVVRIRAGVRQRITNTGETDLLFLCICTPRFRQESYASLE